MPQGWPTHQHTELLRQRQRWLDGRLNEGTPESRRLAFAKWLFEHGVVNENEGEACKTSWPLCVP
jgi:hypothetical protein